MDNVIDITICVDNDAFGIDFEDQSIEVARILRDAAKRIEANPQRYLDPCSGYSLCLKDSNGNRVGSVTTSRI